MKINLKANKIIRDQPYKVAYGLKEEIRKKVQELLDADIILTSTSEYASPVLMIPKKDGELRMCVDYRKLNSMAKRKHFPVPNIEDTLNSLANGRYFTTLDLMNGYHQIPIDPECQHLTAFVTPDGHYEFRRMPFGLTNAPAVFMRLMSEITRRLNSAYLVCYMDDVLIATESIEENLEVLNNFLKEIRKAHLTLNIKKCEFLKNEIKFLGHEISIDGIKPGEAKTSAITEYKRPETTKEVRQFLGLAGYFRRFVQGFSRIAVPLNCLLKKDAEFKWTSEQEIAFNQLKKILSQRPVLALYDGNAEHELHTDASSHGLAGILMQHDQYGNLRPISYFSRATTDAESRYHSYELEALAVVESMERFKHYLLHKHFKVVTDCNSLKLTQEKRDLVPRIARWWLKIAEYDFELAYRPGTQMNHADALSRHPHEKAKESETVSSKVLLIGMDEQDWLSTLQSQDAKLVKIRKVLDGTVVSGEDVDGVKGNYQMQGSRIYKKTDKGLRFVVPGGIRWRVLKLAHDDMGHCGHTRTVEYLQKYFWFPNLRQVAKKYINCCIECLYNKRGTEENKYVLHAPERQPIPFYTVHLDHLGPYPKSKKGNTHLIGMICAFTKFLILKPVKSTATRGVINLMNEVTQYFGNPTRLITDRGTAFTSHEFEKYCKENMIKHVLTSVKTPRANGQIERYFRTVKTSISTLASDAEGRDWDKNISAIQWGLNSLKHSTTGKSPQELLLGYHPRTILKNKLLLALQDEQVDNEEEENIPISELRQRILERIKENQTKQAEKFNSSHRPPRKYKEGDLVLIKQEPVSTGQSRKVQPRYRGPYQIKTVLPNDRYVVTDTRTTQISQKPYESVQAAERLKQWCSLEDMKFDDEDELDENENDMN